MSSFKLNSENIVISVMSFDPIEESAHHLETYDSSILGKRFDNGHFVEVPVEPLPETQTEPQQ